MNVPRETMERLERYEDLVTRWNGKINLVSPTTLPHLRDRHIKDSMQLVDLVPDTEGLWVDLGSGGGLPGLVVAIGKFGSPLNIRLVESDLRKATFLRTVIRELGLSNTSVITDRIESIKPLNASYISARALAPLPRLMAYLDQHLAKDGQAWLMKGETWRGEVQDAKKDWKFNITSYPSRTHSGAAILKISGISHG